MLSEGELHCTKCAVKLFDPINLYAFDPESSTATMPHIFQASAGNWPNTTGNANLVSVVANGEVFVASCKQLQIFGLTGANAA
jgi:hypothetical protein